MSPFVRLASIRHDRRRRSLPLTVLVCLAFVSCGRARLPNAQTGGGAPPPSLPSNPPTPVPTITAAQVLDIARTGLLSFREVYSECQVDASGTCVQPAYVELGFKDQQELDRATLGPPYQEYMLEPAMLKRYTSGTQVARLIAPRAYWTVPILSHGEGRSAITVGFNAGTWSVASYGGQQDLSRNLMVVHKQYAGQPVDLKLVNAYVAYIMLVTEGTHESLVLLHGPSYLAPGALANRLHPVPAEQLLPALVAALPDCPPGGSCN